MGVEGFISHETLPVWHKTVWNLEGENQEQGNWDLVKEEETKNNATTHE